MPQHSIGADNRKLYFAKRAMQRLRFVVASAASAVTASVARPMVITAIRQLYSGCESN